MCSAMDEAGSQGVRKCSVRKWKIRKCSLRKWAIRKKNPQMFAPQMLRPQKKSANARPQMCSPQLGIRKCRRAHCVVSFVNKPLLVY